MDIAYFLNQSLTVYRRVEVDDGQGGTTSTFQSAGSAQFKVDQPSAAEIEVAQQAQSEHSHNIYALPATDVRRGDELRSGSRVYRILSVVEPSESVYRKALATLTQREQ